jgi:hypothetical protein
MRVKIIGLENIRRQLEAMQQPLRETTVTLSSEHESRITPAQPSAVGQHSRWTSPPGPPGN